MRTKVRHVCKNMVSMYIKDATQASFYPAKPQFEVLKFKTNHDTGSLLYLDMTSCDVTCNLADFQSDVGYIHLHGTQALVRRISPRQSVGH